MKTRVLSLILLFLLPAAHSVLACELCKAEQPTGLKNITHGPGPSGMLDYFIMYTAAVIVAVTLFYSIKYLVRPKEDNPDHAKNIILEQGF